MKNELTFTSDPFTIESIVERLRKAGCVFAEDEARLLVAEAKSIKDLIQMVEKRVNGMPFEYILGFANFCGLRIYVEPGVFIPRPRTEFLVQQASSLTSSHDIVIDLCCGSGAIGKALLNEVPNALIYSTDIDPVAVKCATRNLSTNYATVFEGNLYEPLPQSLISKVNMIVANVPYVPTNAIQTLPREAKIYEPKLSLDGGEDGLDFHRKVAKDATRWLADGGYLLVETSEKQATQTLEIFVDVGLSSKIVRDEVLDATVVVGRVSAESDC